MHALHEGKTKGYWYPETMSLEYSYIEHMRIGISMLNLGN